MSGNPICWKNQYTSSAESFNAGQRAERTFAPGQLVRFAPPAGAYSPQSEQSLRAGTAGIVVMAWNDSYAFVTFGEGKALMVNADYLEKKHV